MYILNLLLYKGFNISNKILYSNNYLYLIKYKSEKLINQKLCFKSPTLEYNFEIVVLFQLLININLNLKFKLIVKKYFENITHDISHKIFLSNKNLINFKLDNQVKINNYVEVKNYIKPKMF